VWSRVGPTARKRLFEHRAGACRLAESAGREAGLSGSPTAVASMIIGWLDESVSMRICSLTLTATVAFMSMASAAEANADNGIACEAR
jgi:hypothetical protein